MLSTPIRPGLRSILLEKSNSLFIYNLYSPSSHLFAPSRTHFANSCRRYCRQLAPYRQILPLKKHTRLTIATRAVSMLPFKRINVRNPILARFLSFTRATSKALLVVYCAVIGAIGGGIALCNYYVNSHEPLKLFSSPFGFDSVFILKMGVLYEYVLQNQVNANDFYMAFLRLINKKEGLKYNNDIDYLPEYLSNEDILHKGKQWYDIYIDILLRCSIVKGQIGHLEEAKNLLEKAVSFIEFSGDKNVGSMHLRNNGYRLLAKLYIAENSSSRKSKHSETSIENLMVDSITTMTTQFGVSAENIDELLYLSTSSCQYLSRDLYCSIDELLAHYARHGKSRKSFKIYLHNLKFLEENQEDLKGSSMWSLARLIDTYYLENEVNDAVPFEIRHSDIPLLKFHIAELLWSFKKHDSAINWNKEAFIEAYNYSRQDKSSAVVAKMCIENLITMYKLQNRRAKYDEKIKNCEELSEKIYLPGYSSSWKMILDHLP